MMTPLKRFVEAGQSKAFFQALNKIVDRINQLSVVETPNSLTQITPRGTMKTTQATQQGGSTGSSEMRFRGEWSEDETYVEGDVVVVRGGVNAGCFISTADGNTSSPWSSSTWVSLSDNNSIGRWGG